MSWLDKIPQKIKRVVGSVQKKPSGVIVALPAIERTKSREHGDYASNIAMLLAKPARSNPRSLAQKLLDAMPASANVLRVEIAGPGFINFFLSDDAWRRELIEILRRGNAYGRSTVGGGQRVGVEYVSANPTGPLHVGHGRAAAIGDTLARLLAATGWEINLNTKNKRSFGVEG